MHQVAALSLLLALTILAGAERLVDVASAIQVITAGDIRRSRASSLPRALNAAVSSETADGRRVVVQLLQVTERTKTCHILYTTDASPRQVKEVAAAVAGKSGLTVRDSSTSASPSETVIALVNEQPRSACASI